MELDEYFASDGPPCERAVFETVLAHLERLDPDVWFEPVSVGIFFKRRSTFLSLRTMTKWVALSFSLDRQLKSGRLSRKVIAHGGRYHHVINISDVADIDEEILDWLTEAWEADDPGRR